MLLCLRRLTSNLALYSRKIVQNSWRAQRQVCCMSELPSPGDPHYCCGIAASGLARTMLWLPPAATFWHFMKCWWKHRAVKNKEFFYVLLSQEVCIDTLSFPCASPDVVLPESHNLYSTLVKAVTVVRTPRSIWSFFCLKGGESTRL